MIGKKIKAERKKRGLTQSALAGDKITRNMLSRIESESATPSLDTLEYIAKRLSLPVSYLLADECDENAYVRMAAMPKIRAAYRDGDYAYAIKLGKEVAELDDELALILAYSNFNLGKAATLSGALKSGASYLKESLKYSKETIYDTAKIECAVPLYSALCSNIQSPLLEFDARGFLDAFRDVNELEFYNYLTLNFDYVYSNTAYSEHLEAKRLINGRDYQKALAILLPLVDEIRRLGYNAYMMLSVYTDVESCYRQIQDFENAYKYARKRMSLGEGFNS